MDIKEILHQQMMAVRQRLIWKTLEDLGIEKTAQTPDLYGVLIEQTLDEACYECMTVIQQEHKQKELET